MQEVLDYNPFSDYENCPSCGSKMFELKAKWVCEKCNYKRGCCDLM